MDFEAKIYEKISKFADAEKITELISTTNLYGDPVWALKSLSMRIGTLSLLTLANNISSPNNLANDKLGDLESNTMILALKTILALLGKMGGETIVPEIIHSDNFESNLIENTIYAGMGSYVGVVLTKSILDVALDKLSRKPNGGNLFNKLYKEKNTYINISGVIAGLTGILYGVYKNNG